MKNLSLLVLFFCTFNYSFAQVEFPKLNATWCYTASGDFGEPLYNVCFSPDSLIEINDLEYSRVIGLDYIYDTIYYREENRKLYILPEDSINEILLCDFNLNMGDKFMKPHWGWFENESALLTVYGVDSIVTLDGVTRKIIYLYTETGPSANTYWIEGIGDMSWLFLFPNYYGSLSGGYHFLCYGIDGEFIYPEGNESYCSSLISTKNIEQKKIRNFIPQSHLWKVIRFRNYEL